ncbi:alpha/beta fold hydrolase [Roseovarius salis]|uniref:alpha/beta fold hydrolase n=1 Tax=Roseovarius salis TaxID=3376063 RepID=UPI0037C5330F
MQDPLVFLPGMMCDARVFAAQVMAFSPRLAVTVAPVTGGDRVEEIASRLLDVLPRRFSLVGLSMGGIVAMELLRRAPDRITRLALMDTNALAETPQSAADYEPVIIKLRAGRIDEAAQALVPTSTLAPGPGRMAVMADIAAMARAIGAEAIIRQVRAVQRRRDYQAVLRRCRLPALVLCGTHDSLTPPKRHELMAGLLPNSTLHVVDGAGHLPVMEQPEAVNAALAAWLQEPAPEHA